MCYSRDLRSRLWRHGDYFRSPYLRICGWRSPLTAAAVFIAFARPPPRRRWFASFMPVTQDTEVNEGFIPHVNISPVTSYHAPHKLTKRSVHCRSLFMLTIRPLYLCHGYIETNYRFPYRPTHRVMLVRQAWPWHLAQTISPLFTALLKCLYCFRVTYLVSWMSVVSIDSISNRLFNQIVFLSL